jgi:hypothetical protein
MESTTLASGEDASLILKLYELRREETMRKARQWVCVEFWPDSAQEIFFLLDEFGSLHNQYFRQVTTYWEMAASFVLRGALDGDMFLECTAENTFILAKFHPFLAEIRERLPDFLIRTEQLMQKYAGAKANLDRALRQIERRRAESAGRATSAI